MTLNESACASCRDAFVALDAAEAARLATEIPAWRVVENHHLAREWDFQDFVTALAFVNRIGGIAEEQGHHPDIALAWGKVRVTIWTHKVNGLTESDFLLAGLIDKAAA